MLQKVKEQISKFFISLIYNKRPFIAVPVNNQNISVLSSPQAESNTCEDLNAYAAVAAANGNYFYEGQSVSRFNNWIRSIALIVICVFIPDQISWAFNYNPAILYGAKAPNIEMMSMVTPAEQTSMLISGSIDRLLGQVVGKPASRIDLKVDDGQKVGFWERKAHEYTLRVDWRNKLTTGQAKEMVDWLSSSDIDPLNCGVYALNDILAANGIKKTPEEVSVMTLSVDLLAGIVKPGDKKLKTTLFALSKVAEAFKLDYKAAKLNPADVLKLTPPFIANFNGEHFVTVTGVDADVVGLMDTG